MTTILLCDDHLMLLDAFRTVLERRGHVVETTTRPDEAVELVRRGRRFGLVVMDLSFPDATGVDGVRAVLAADPDARVLVLSACVDDEVLEDALAAGALAVVDKAQPLTATVAAVERAADSVDTSPADQGSRTPPIAGAQSFLTARERQVVKMLVRGATTREIAAELGIAYTTARSHVQNVLQKLGAHSRLEATATAVRLRLTSADISAR
jgi:DNA-binding NarL/FixJ family response regulator